MIVEKLDTSFKARVHAILFKPFVMLALEPMLLTIVTYMSLAYGIMYLLVSHSIHRHPIHCVRPRGGAERRNGLRNLMLDVVPGDSIRFRG
jgi:hypothetical protein